MPQTYAFLLKCIETGVYRVLDPRRRNLIGAYLGSREATLKTLAPLAGGVSREWVRQLLVSGLEELWRQLPPELQTEFPEEKVIKLKEKTARSIEARARISETSKQRWQDPEYRARISETLRQKWQDPEFRARISKALKGRSHTPETRARISEAQKGRTFSEETRARMSEARKRYWQKIREYKATPGG